MRVHIIFKKDKNLKALDNNNTIKFQAFELS